MPPPRIGSMWMSSAAVDISPCRDAASSGAVVDSLATGIVFASVIILFIVPALIVIREDFTLERWRQRAAALLPGTKSSPPAAT